MSLEESYLKAILSTVARQTFPPTVLVELVAPAEAKSKLLPTIFVTAYILNHKSQQRLEWIKAI